jgi:hypothetical protein
MPEFTQNELQEIAVSATELRRMPPEKRAEILQRQAEFAEHLYRTLPELTEIAECDDEVFDGQDEQAEAG